MLVLILLALVAIIAFGVGFTIHWLFIVALIAALLWLISLFHDARSCARDGGTRLRRRTLIDWNGGIGRELERLFGAARGGELLRAYHELEPEIQREDPSRGATAR